MSGDYVIRGLVVRTVVWLAITAAFLFVPAGTLQWPGAWVLLAEFAILGFASGISIGRSDPALLRERMASPIQRAQKGWDKILLMTLFFFWMAQYVVAGLDQRFQASHVPPWLQAVGALLVALGYYMFHAVMRANTFAAPVVKIQTERKHHVVSTGPYAYVRHPMYAGAVPLTVGTALLLGSWWALLCALAAIIILCYRAVLEEETLKSELEGYEAYAARVRYRLMPGIW